MTSKNELTTEQVREILAGIDDALLELGQQRRRSIERLGPTSAEAFDLQSTISRLRGNKGTLLRLTRRATPEVSSRGEAREREPLPEVQLLETHVDEDSLDDGDLREGQQEPQRLQRKKPGQATAASTRQFYLRYWFGISSDQLYVDVFVRLTEEPTELKASGILARALRLIEWSTLNSDNTDDLEDVLLLREGREIQWGFEMGVQEPEIPLNPGEALISSYRMREVDSEYPGLSSTKDKFVDEDGLL